MGNATFSDSTPDNPKLIAAGAPAAWLWFAGVCYCRRTFTDGFIPNAKVPTLVTGLKGSFRFAGVLCEVGLWHKADGGYTINDYLRHNPSKVEVEDYKKGDRDRKRRERASRDTSVAPVRSDSPNGRPYAGADTGAPRASAKYEKTNANASSDRVGSGTSEEIARETAPSILAELSEAAADAGPVSEIPPSWGPRHTRTSPLVVIHPGCLPCTGAACQRGLCVPRKLADGWYLQLGQTPAAEARIRDVVSQALARIPVSQGIGDDLFALWRGEWSAHHASHARPVVAPSSHGKGNAAAAAASRVLARRAGGDL